MLSRTAARHRDYDLERAIRHICGMPSGKSIVECVAELVHDLRSVRSVRVIGAPAAVAGPVVSPPPAVHVPIGIRIRVVERPTHSFERAVAGDAHVQVESPSWRRLVTLDPTQGRVGLEAPREVRGHDPLQVERDLLVPAAPRVADRYRLGNAGRLPIL